jgi:hypothetical protein
MFVLINFILLSKKAFSKVAKVIISTINKGY